MEQQGLTGHCQLHQCTMEQKTGQFGPYWSHIINGVGFCDGKKIKPFKQTNGHANGQMAVQAPVTREPIPQRDFDAEARGKCRCAVVVAMIEHGGIEALKGQQTKIDSVVEYIMTGKSSTPEQSGDS